MKHKEEIKNFITDLVLLKSRCMSLKMYKTYWAIHTATQIAGWELAEKLTPKKRKRKAK